LALRIFASTRKHVDAGVETCSFSILEIMDNIFIDTAKWLITSNNCKFEPILLQTLESWEAERLRNVETKHRTVDISQKCAKNEANHHFQI
jgi:hypothetical protein